MIRTKHLLLLSVPLALLAADQPWKDKQMTQWTEDDAKEILTDSPWAKPATPSTNQSNSQRGSRGMGRGGGMGRGSIGLGIPGVGMGGGGRRGGMGGPGGGGYPRDGRGRRDSESNGPFSVIVRWESAMPIQQAELKSKATDAPSIDEKHYAIVVAGLPVKSANDPQMTESHLKGQAQLKRDGKKLSKPSDVRVLSRDEGLLVVYLFPRSKEIRKNDTQIEFGAKMGRWELKQTFNPTEMTYQGKLEL